MIRTIENFTREFLEKTKDKDIQIISHHDTDGITSAAIVIKALKRLDKKFSLKIVKGLEEDMIYDLSSEKINLFLDLASGNLKQIAESNIETIFIIDHHEIPLGTEVPKNVKIINPQLHDKEMISASGLTYLFAKQLNEKNKDLAKIAVLGIIGDSMDKNIGKLGNIVFQDAEIVKKRGVLIYPSTRPLNRALEFSSNPYIPGVTGNSEGALELLKEANIKFENGKIKSLIELNEDEMARLVTAILLRRVKKNHDEDIIGDIYLIKLFNKLEDTRELSAMVNACSRLGESEISLMLCLENEKAKQKAEELYAKYKQFLISGLKLTQNLKEGTEKIKGKKYLIVNAKDKIKDTIIGTIASILSNSSVYEEGTIITTMAYVEDERENSKIKVSSRMVGKTGRNVRVLLSDIISEIGGDIGGHANAAGCLISRDKEEDFINLLRKNLELEVVKI